MDLSKIYSKSWDLIKKYKVLWLFGLFAGCGQSTFGTSSYSADKDYATTFSTSQIPPGLQRWFLNMERFAENNPGKFFMYILLISGAFAFIALLIGLLRVYGKAGLISGVKLSEKDAAALTFQNINEELKKYFWKIVLLYLLIWAVNLMISLILVGLFFTIILAIPVICFAFIYGLIYALLVNQFPIALILEDIDPFEAIQRTIQVVFSNIPLYLTVGVINLIGLMVISFLFGLPLIALFGAWLILNKITFAAMLVAAIILAVVITVLFGPIKAFLDATWTLLNLDEVAT
jgi:hypothetical protein